MQITISRRSAFMIVLAMLLVVPALAFGTDVFDDVSDTSVHGDGIGFMQSSGVSVGCDATNYCPSDNVTRAQMGTFLYRLSGNDPATPPSVNAATVGGVAVTDVVRAGTDSVGLDVVLEGTALATDFDALNDATVTVPSDGAVLVLWSGYTACGGADIAEVQLFVDGVPDFSSFIVPDCAAAGDFSSHSFQNLIPVTTGEYQFEVRGRDTDGAPNDVTMRDSRLTLVFIPFDMTGSSTFSPLSVTEPPTSGSGPGGS